MSAMVRRPPVESQKQAHAALTMTTKILKEHYERKYASEEASSTVELVATGRVPTDRFQATVQNFPKCFTGGEILELGAGSGAVAKTLLQAGLPIRGYTLGDISMPRLEGLRRNLEDPRVSIVTMDAESVDAVEAKFDAIIMIALIEHLIDPMGAMTGICRLLRPGGFAYIDTPNIAKFTQRIRLLFGKFPSTASKNEGLTTYAGDPTDLFDEGHLHYFTFRSLSQMLVNRCGFASVTWLPYPGGFRPLGLRAHACLAAWWPQMFSELALVAHVAG